MVTTDTAQTITASKTFENFVTCFGNKFRIRQPSSGSGDSIKPTVSLRNANDEEVGFLQYHPTNNQIVYGANEKYSSGIQVALRQYATGKAYSALLPTTADKYSNIGSGDVTFPLGIKVGSNGTVLKANNGGLVELPDFVTVDTYQHITSGKNFMGDVKFSNSNHIPNETYISITTSTLSNDYMAIIPVKGMYDEIRSYCGTSLNPWTAVNADIVNADDISATNVYATNLIKGTTTIAVADIASKTDVSTAISGQTKETWTFTLADGTTTTKTIVLG